jgi:hypothetical protein
VTTTAIREQRPSAARQQLLPMGRDGAMVDGHLDDAETIRTNLSRAVTTVLSRS